MVDDDEVVSSSFIKANLAAGHTLIVQEKVDGCNVSVHFQQEWVPILQKRSGLISQGEKHAQYNVFRDWVNENLETLWEILGTKYVLFGEWLWNQHAVSYDSLPSFFLAFDILEKSSSKFLSYERVKTKIGKRVQIVPLLLSDKGDKVKNVKQLVQLVPGKSAFSAQEDKEGIYVRFESPEYVIDRVKVRRKTFTSGRDNFKTIINNKLKK